MPVSQVLKALRQAGWEVSGGSKHYKLIHTRKPGALTVPRGTIKKGTLRAIIRQAGMTVERFLELCK
jgi:predicted RNA binding protein YcfA (HicA-like mRNA interferase family)